MKNAVKCLIIILSVIIISFILIKYTDDGDSLFDFTKKSFEMICKDELMTEIFNLDESEITEVFGDDSESEFV